MRRVNAVYPLLEITASLFFIAVAVAALRRGRLPFLELVSAAAFGLLLEEGDQLIFETYHYADEWTLVIDRAPVVIGLTWALIIAGAMRITDALRVPRRYAPFLDAVLAITLDLAFDAVAIRMGLWTWRDIGPTDGWFGVPAGNFYSWLFVTLGFSLMTRWVRAAALGRPRVEWLQLLVPLPAFLILLASIAVYAVLQERLEPEPGGGLFLFAITFIVFVVVAAIGIGRPHREPDNDPANAMLDLRLAFATRLAIHGFFLVALLAMGLAVQLPVLLIVALLMLALELPLAWLVTSRLDAGDATTVRGRRAVGRYSDPS